ncbi:hypothetical protein K438DRAFT_1854190, partial [Mycena galopus ATCC 62051]
MPLDSHQGHRRAGCAIDLDFLSTLNADPFPFSHRSISMDRRLHIVDLRFTTGKYLLIAFSSFTARCVYDGRKKIFSIHKLKFDTGYQEFDVTLTDESPSAPGKGPKVYKIKLTLVAEFNPEGKASHDNIALTAITALNVSMQPSLLYPFMFALSSPTARPRTSALFIQVSGKSSSMSASPPGQCAKRFGFCFIVVFVDLANHPLMPVSAPLPRVHEEPSERFISHPCAIRIHTTHLGPDGQKHRIPR